jgi:N-acetylneuraminate synthase
VTLDELRQLVEGVRFIETMMRHPLDKDVVAQEMAPLRNLFTKSVVAKLDLPAGTVLRGEHLVVKKPGTGIPAARLPELVGRTLRRSVAADQLVLDIDVI